MPAAWLHRGRSWPAEMTNTPDFVIGSLRDLTDILGIDLSEQPIGAV